MVAQCISAGHLTGLRAIGQLLLLKTKRRKQKIFAGQPLTTPQKFSEVTSPLTYTPKQSPIQRLHGPHKFTTESILSTENCDQLWIEREHSEEGREKERDRKREKGERQKRRDIERKRKGDS